MKLKAWREHHGVSARAAAKLFGSASAANMIRIENGETWTGAFTATRIHILTSLTGPEPVTPNDLLEVWHNFHRAESRKADLAARQMARGMKAKTQSKDEENGT